MGLADYFRRSKATMPAKSEAPILAMGGDWLIDVPAVAKTGEYLAAYKSWTFACASIIASTIAKVPLRMFKGDEEIERHIFLDTWNRPNPFTTGVEFAELMALYIDLAGEAFIVGERNMLGAPAEFWLLPPPWVKVIPSKQTFIAGYRVQYGAAKVDIPIEDITHVKQPNPNNLYRGMSTVEAVAAAVDTDTFAQEYNKRFLENSGIPAGVLNVEGKMSEDDKEYMKRQWQKGHRGKRNAGRLAILEKGTTYMPIGITQKDMDYAELRRFTRDEILGGWGVPASKLGLVEDVNRANAEANDMTFNKEVIAPRLRRIEARLNATLIPQYDAGLRVAFDNPVPADAERERADTSMQIERQIITINEARADVGREPVPWGEVPLVPFNLVPIDEAAASFAETPAAASAARDAARHTHKHEETHRAPLRAEPHMTYDMADGTTKKPTPQQLRALVRHQRASIQQLAPKFKKRYASLLKVQQGKVIAALEEQRSALSLAGVTYVDAKQWEEEIDRVAKIAAAPLVKVVEGDVQYIAETMAPYIQNGVAAGVQVGDVLGLDINFDLVNPRVREAVRGMGKRFSEGVAKTTRNDIRRACAAAIDRGEGIPELKARINEIYEYAKTGRAEMAARTETAQAYSYGELASWAEAGAIVKGKSWYWGGDEVDCPEGVCPDNEGDGTIELGADFSSGDMAPPAHPNCTCALIPEVEFPE